MIEKTMENLPSLENQVDTLGEHKPKKRKLLFFILIFPLCLSLVLFLWWLFQRKSYGSVTVRTVPVVSPQEGAQTQAQYRGKFVRFDYSNDYTKKPDIDLKKPLLERLYLARTDIEGQKIALMVQAVDYPLAEYSSFRIRADDPKTYVQEKIVRNGLNMTLFTKNFRVFEVGAFLIQSGKVASIVVSSPTQMEGLREELLAILDTFAWVDSGESK